MTGYIKHWTERAMLEPEINSRFVYLLQGVVIALSSAALVIGFFIAQAKENYPSMLAAVLGGGLAAPIGRMFTKFGSRGRQPPTPEGTLGVDDKVV